MNRQAEKKKKNDEKDEEFPLADLPAEVLKAADEAAPKVKWETAYRDEEGKTVLYEVVGKNAEEREVAVLVTAEGKVESVETEILLADVPEVVLDRLKKKFPRFVASNVFEVQEEGKVVGYDFEGKRPKDKQDIGISVSADGKEAQIDE